MNKSSPNIGQVAEGRIQRWGRGGRTESAAKIETDLPVCT